MVRHVLGLKTEETSDRVTKDDGEGNFIQA